MIFTGFSPLCCDVFVHLSLEMLRCFIYLVQQLQLRSPPDNFANTIISQDASSFCTACTDTNLLPALGSSLWHAGFSSCSAHTQWLWYLGLVAVCGILVHWQRSNLGPLHWDRRVLFIGPPRESPQDRRLYLEPFSIFNDGTWQFLKM